MEKNEFIEILSSYKYAFLSIGNSYDTCFRNVLAASNSIYHQLQELSLTDASWKFFIAQYDLKNELENLTSNNPSVFNENEFSYFIPEQLSLDFPDNEIETLGQLRHSHHTWHSSVNCLSTRDEYLLKVRKIKEHIQKGDIYVANFCISFKACVTGINPMLLFYLLNSKSKAPFSSLYKLNDTYVICSSPERFLSREKNTLVSQPIKGTSARRENSAEDLQEKKNLFESQKERNENVMIVDVVRNDLSRLANRGTVKVDELFGVYSFRHVHQMISTVSCEINSDLTFEDIFKATFPMASMTGAPKIKAMELMDQYENFRREFYSGTMGYVDNKGDFDANVIIRSIYYNVRTGDLSFSVGSAITDKCDPEKEYEECLLKAKSIIDVLSSLS